MNARMLAVFAILLTATTSGGRLAAAVMIPAAGDSTTRELARGAADSASAARPLEQTAPPESLAAPRAAVPVFLGGKQVYVVHSARSGLEPVARAAAIRARLDAAVVDATTPADSVWMRRTGGGIEVWLGGHYLWFIQPADVEAMSVHQLATYAAGLPSMITRGILRERSGRSPRGLLIASAIALGTTIVAWVLFRLLLAAGRRWRAFLGRTLPKVLGGVRIGTFEVLSESQLEGAVVGVFGRLDLVAGLFLLYGYLTAVFSLFPWSQGWSWRLFDFARDEVVRAATAVGRAIPSVLVLVGLFILFRWLTQLSYRFFDAIEAGTVKIEWVHPELARPTKRLVGILLWIIGAAIAYPYIPGSQSKAVQGISILLGVMVSLGSSGIVGNVIAGLVLTYSRSFSRGDRVRIGDQVGDVVNLGFFATKLRSPRNEEITLANGQIASQPIVNYTRLAGNAGLVLHTQVTIGYENDWRNVHAMLIEAAGRVEGVEKEPAPWVFQRSLNDYHITYEICCVTRESHQLLRLYSRLHEEIQDAFARAGVEILSPAYSALRDANAVVLPAEPKGPRAAPGAFRVRPPGA